MPPEVALAELGAPELGPPELGAPGMGRMQRFVADLLAAAGGVAEAIHPEGLELLAPPPAQQALGVVELCRLGFGATLPPGAQRVGLESDWLDRFDRLLDGRGRWTRRVLGPEGRAPSDPERVLQQELVLDNATYRLLRVAPAWTRYLVLDFRYSAVSDDKRDGVLRLGVNLATGGLCDAVVEAIAPWLAADGADAELPDGIELPRVWDQQRVLAVLAQALPPRLDAALRPFVKGLHRRLSRDQDRLHGYHNELHREATRRAAALPSGDPRRKREEQRIEAVGREYQAKLDDLARQYAMRVKAEWVQTLEVVMPVQRFDVQIRRRKADRTIQLDWNPLARRLEPPVCEFSRSAERPRLVCDDALHLVVSAGLAPCFACAKPFCRACHPDRCPKCGEAAAGAVAR